MVELYIGGFLLASIGIIYLRYRRVVTEIQKQREESAKTEEAKYRG